MTEDVIHTRPSGGIRTLAVCGLIVAFCVPALLMLARMGAGDGVSLTERRALQTVPSYEGDARAYTAAFDDYLEDNFGGRLPLIRINRTVRVALGEGVADVVFGKENWLFLGTESYRDEFEGRGVWDAAQVESWIDTMVAMRTALEARDIPFAAFIALDKARAYPEYLPDDWTQGERRFRRALHDHPDAARAGLIDAEPHVMAAKARGAKTFYLRDTHWTADGTYDLAMAVMDRFDPMGVRPRYVPDPPRLRAMPVLLDLDAMAGFETSNEPDAVVIRFPPIHPDDRALLDPESPDSPFRGQFATLRMTGSAGPDGMRLVIVGDSFADAMLPHFLPSVSEIVRLHHGSLNHEVTLADILAHDPDAVLFVAAEREAATLPRPFAAPASD